MKLDLNQNPQLAATVIVCAAPTEALMWFVGHSVRMYFTRLIEWKKPEQLAKYGLRSVASPIAAEEALKRIEYMEFNHTWVHALIANDPEAARLALRAVEYYAKRYSTMHPENVSNEVGEPTMQAIECAQILMLGLDLSAFDL